MARRDPLTIVLWLLIELLAPSDVWGCSAISLKPALGPSSPRTYGPVLGGCDGTAVLAQEEQAKVTAQKAADAAPNPTQSFALLVHSPSSLSLPAAAAANAESIGSTVARRA